MTVAKVLDTLTAEAKKKKLKQQTQFIQIFLPFLDKLGKVVTGFGEQDPVFLKFEDDALKLVEYEIVNYFKEKEDFEGADAFIKILEEFKNFDFESEEAKASLEDLENFDITRERIIEGLKEILELKTVELTKDNIDEEISKKRTELYRKEKRNFKKTYGVESSELEKKEIDLKTQKKLEKNLEKMFMEKISKPVHTQVEVYPYLMGVKAAERKEKYKFIRTKRKVESKKLLNIDLTDSSSNNLERLETNFLLKFDEDFRNLFGGIGGLSSGDKKCYDDLLEICNKSILEIQKEQGFDFPFEAVLYKNSLIEKTLKEMYGVSEDDLLPDEITNFSETLQQMVEFKDCSERMFAIQREEKDREIRLKKHEEALDDYARAGYFREKMKPFKNARRAAFKNKKFGQVVIIYKECCLREKREPLKIYARRKVAGMTQEEKKKYSVILDDEEVMEKIEKEAEEYFLVRGFKRKIVEKYFVEYDLLKVIDEELKAEEKAIERIIDLEKKLMILKNGFLDEEDRTLSNEEAFNNLASDLTERNNIAKSLELYSKILEEEGISKDLDDENYEKHFKVVVAGEGEVDIREIKDKKVFNLAFEKKILPVLKRRALKERLRAELEKDFVKERKNKFGIPDIKDIKILEGEKDLAENYGKLRFLYKEIFFERLKNDEKFREEIYRRLTKNYSLSINEELSESVLAEIDYKKRKEIEQEIEEIKNLCRAKKISPRKADKRIKLLKASFNLKVSCDLLNARYKECVLNNKNFKNLPVELQIFLRAGGGIISSFSGDDYFIKLINTIQKILEEADQTDDPTYQEKVIQFVTKNLVGGKLSTDFIEDLKYFENIVANFDPDKLKEDVEAEETFEEKEGAELKKVKDEEKLEEKKELQTAYVGNTEFYFPSTLEGEDVKVDELQTVALPTLEEKGILQKLREDGIGGITAEFLDGAVDRMKNQSESAIVEFMHDFARPVFVGLHFYETDEEHQLRIDTLATERVQDEVYKKWEDEIGSAVEDMERVRWEISCSDLDYKNAEKMKVEFRKEKVKAVKELVAAKIKEDESKEDEQDPEKKAKEYEKKRDEYAKEIAKAKALEKWGSVLAGKTGDIFETMALPENKKIVKKIKADLEKERAKAFKKLTVEKVKEHELKKDDKFLEEIANIAADKISEKWKEVVDNTPQIMNVVKEDSDTPDKKVMKKIRDDFKEKKAEARKALIENEKLKKDKQFIAAAKAVDEAYKKWKSVFDMLPEYTKKIRDIHDNFDLDDEEKVKEIKKIEDKLNEEKAKALAVAVRALNSIAILPAKNFNDPNFASFILHMKKVASDLSGGFAIGKVSNSIKEGMVKDFLVEEGTYIKEIEKTQEELEALERKQWVDEKKKEIEKKRLEKELEEKVENVESGIFGKVMGGVGNILYGAGAKLGDLGKDLGTQAFDKFGGFDKLKDATGVDFREEGLQEGARRAALNVAKDYTGVDLEKEGLEGLKRKGVEQVIGEQRVGFNVLNHAVKHKLPKFDMSYTRKKEKVDIGKFLSNAFSEVYNFFQRVFSTYVPETFTLMENAEVVEEKKAKKSFRIDQIELSKHKRIIDRNIFKADQAEKEIKSLLLETSNLEKEMSYQLREQDSFNRVKYKSLKEKIKRLKDLQNSYVEFYEKIRDAVQFCSKQDPNFRTIHLKNKEDFDKKREIWEHLNHECQMAFKLLDDFEKLDVSANDFESKVEIVKDTFVHQRDKLAKIEEKILYGKLREIPDEGEFEKFLSEFNEEISKVRNDGDEKGLKSEALENIQKDFYKFRQVFNFYKFALDQNININDLDMFISENREYLSSNRVLRVALTFAFENNNINFIKGFLNSEFSRRKEFLKKIAIEVAKTGNIELMNYLLDECNFDINERFDGNTVAHIAIANGKNEFVKNLFNRSQFCTSVKNDDGKTVLDVMEGNEELQAYYNETFRVESATFKPKVSTDILDGIKGKSGWRAVGTKFYKIMYDFGNDGLVFERKLLMLNQDLKSINEIIKYFSGELTKLSPTAERFMQEHFTKEEIAARKVSPVKLQKLTESILQASKDIKEKFEKVSKNAMKEITASDMYPSYKMEDMMKGIGIYNESDYYGNIIIGLAEEIKEHASKITDRADIKKNIFLNRKKFLEEKIDNLKRQVEFFDKNVIEKKEEEIRSSMEKIRKHRESKRLFKDAEATKKLGVAISEYYKLLDGQVSEVRKTLGEFSVHYEETKKEVGEEFASKLTEMESMVNNIKGLVLPHVKKYKKDLKNKRYENEFELNARIKELKEISREANNKTIINRFKNDIDKYLDGMEKNYTIPRNLNRNVKEYYRTLNKKIKIMTDDFQNLCKKCDSLKAAIKEQKPVNKKMNKEMERQLNLMETKIVEMRVAFDKTLKEYKKELNDRKYEKELGLYQAARDGDLEKLKELIKNFPDKNNLEDRKILRKAFFIAGRYGKRIIVRHFLLTYFQINDETDEAGNNILHVVSEQGDEPKTVSYLLNLNADPKKQNVQGDTALILAIKNENKENVNALMRTPFKKVDPFLENHEGKHAVDYAKKSKEMKEFVPKLQSYKEYEKSNLVHEVKPAHGPLLYYFARDNDFSKINELKTIIAKSLHDLTKMHSEVEIKIQELKDFEEKYNRGDKFSEEELEKIVINVDYLENSEAKKIRLSKKLKAKVNSKGEVTSKTGIFDLDKSEFVGEIVESEGKFFLKGKGEKLKTKKGKVIEADKAEFDNQERVNKELEVEAPKIKDELEDLTKLFSESKNLVKTSKRISDDLMQFRGRRRVLV